VAPRSANLLDVPHRHQIDDGYCLPACVQMVLDYLDLTIPLDHLIRQLDVRPPLGAPASNVRNLRSDALDVTFTSGTLSDLRSHLAQSNPPIVFVQAGELAHWRGRVSQHAIVVVGIDEQNVYILDPAAEDRPIPIPIGDFMLAWVEMDNLYALIRRAKP